MWKKLLIGVALMAISGFIGFLTAGGLGAKAVTDLEKKHDKDVSRLSVTIAEIQMTNKYTKEKLDEISRNIKDLERSINRDGRP